MLANIQEKPLIEEISTTGPVERHRNFGIRSEQVEKWISKTVGEESHNPINFLKFVRRQDMLIMSSLKGETYHPDTMVSDWIGYGDEESYWSRRHNELVNSQWEEKTVVDIGAGLGSLLEYSLRADVLPKKMILVEPHFTGELKDRISEIFGPDIQYEETGNKTTYHFNDKEIIILKAAAGKGELSENLKDEQIDIILMAGVAPHLKWEDPNEISLQDVLTEINTLKSNSDASVAFSFSLDTEFSTARLDTIPDYIKNKFEDIFSNWNTKGRFNAQQLQQYGYKTGRRIFYGNYIAQS